MEELQEELKRLIDEACQHPPGSQIRQKKLTQIIGLVAPKLWKERTDYYEDALQLTWMYFVKHLCEYDVQKAGVAHWLNNHLKWRLHDLRVKQAQTNVAQISIDAQNANPDRPRIDIADPSSSAPDDGESAWMAEFNEWLKTDPQGTLQAIHLRGLPHINCQILIQRRLIQEDSWETLAQDLDKPISSLSAHFQRRCIPCLRTVWDDLRNNDNSAR